MSRYDIHQGDLLRWAETYEGEPFHALLADPPYEIGFMGRGWDNTGIAFQPDTWKALAEHLHPGAYGMAFSSTRTYHRMACAIEDAGLIIHTMMGWAFGSGFPKATRIDVQLDRRAGAERPVVGERKHAPKFDAKRHGYREKDNGFNSRDRQSFSVTASATDLARTWEGYRYGGQAIKPAFEPIVVFQRPYEGKPVDSIARTGAGALNVDGGRVGHVSTMRSNRADMGYNGGLTLAGDGYTTGSESGRWPANLLLVHQKPLQVMRLRAIISPEIEELLRGYYRDYNRVQALRKTVRGMAGKSESRPNEVLQQSLQGSIPDSVDRREEQTNGSETLRSGAIEDATSGTSAETVWTGASAVEGRNLRASRLSVCADCDTECGRSGASNADGAQERLCSGASLSGGAKTWAASDTLGGSTSYERGQARQPAGELSADGGRGAFTAAPEDRSGTGETSRGKPPLEVIVDDVSPGWLQYFEPTGEYVGGCTDAECVLGCAVRRLGEQSGERPASNVGPNSGYDILGTTYGNGTFNTTRGADYGDTGTAARFFYNSTWMLDRLDAADPVRYVAKASTAEREAGLDGWERTTVDDGRQTPIDNPYLRGETQRRNTHPTIKPIDLCRYLATLLLPPAAYAPRRLLVPFSGAGSEMIGAGLAGWEHIQGIELEADHVAIARARLAWWIDVFGGERDAAA